MEYCSLRKSYQLRHKNIEPSICSANSFPNIQDIFLPEERDEHRQETDMKFEATIIKTQSTTERINGTTKN